MKVVKSYTFERMAPRTIHIWASEHANILGVMQQGKLSNALVFYETDDMEHQYLMTVTAIVHEHEIPPSGLYLGSIGFENGPLLHYYRVIQ